MARDRQDDDYDWFSRNFSRFYERYGDCHLVIKDRHVIGRYASFAEGVRAAEKTEELGTFIVQKVCEDVRDTYCYIN